MLGASLCLPGTLPGPRKDGHVFFIDFSLLLTTALFVEGFPFLSTPLFGN